MTQREITITIITILITSSLIALGGNIIQTRAEHRRIELERAALDGKLWMEDTTARLETIATGIERITGEALELAQRVDRLSDRVDALEAPQ